MADKLQRAKDLNGEMFGLKVADDGGGEFTPVMIDEVHEKVHDGELFTASNIYGAVGAGVTVNAVLVTGSKPVHLTFSLAADGATTVLFSEGATHTGGGALARFNNNRNVAALPETTLLTAVTVTANGTVFLNQYVNGGTGAGGTRSGGATRENIEWILKPATEYLIRFTNNSASASNINIAIQFYEAAVNAS